MSSKNQIAAAARGLKRSLAIEIKVRSAMSDIMSETESNNGVYPHNQGRITKNEVARRAGISLSTLFSAPQRKLGTEVSAWLISVTPQKPPEGQRKRRGLQDKLQEYRILCGNLETSQIALELELQSLTAELADARQIIESQKLEIATLRSMRPHNID